MPAKAQLATMILDCTDPNALAEFYRAVTGWEETYRDPDCVHLGPGEAAGLGFQRVQGYQPPEWPSPVKQAHLDFTVADIEQAVAELLALGATKPDFQPGGGEWVVLADPQGHLLCLVGAG
jgi:predicted enzyme related to lactoylglutathione lyase